MLYIQLKDKSYSVENLPSEPRLLIELLDLCHDDNANFETFSKAIQQDAGLTARILQVANSPSYRQWNEITDIRRMLIVLGLTNVRNIVTTCAIQQFFANFSKNFSKNTQFIWLRALLCAHVAQRLAKLTGYPNPGEAFLAGLLHQIGMLLLLANQSQDYMPILDRYYADPFNFSTIEQNLLQVDHCELGAALVNSWNIDSFIADAIEFQHAPVNELNTAPALLKIIAVAAPLSAYNKAYKHEEPLSRAGELFNLTEETIFDCVQSAVEKSQKMIIDLGFSGRFYLEQDERNYDGTETVATHNTQLGQRVRDLALAGTIGREEKAEYIELAKHLRLNFRTLFYLDKILFFRITQDGSQLIPVNDQNDRQLDKISCAMSNQQSIMIATLLSGEGAFSCDQHCSVIDKQVMRILNREIAYFLPLGSKSTPLGLVVLGLRNVDVTRVKERCHLLRLLGSAIAASYQRINRQQAQEIGISMLEFRKIAHEVSNPLTIIRNYLYILGKKLEANTDIKEDLNYINEEIDRAGNILLRAKENAQSPNHTDNMVDINRMIKSLDQLFKSSLFQNNNITSELILDQHIPTAICSAPDKLKQILINLIKNAVEAMPNQGKIEIRTRDNCYQDGKNFVEISIRDSGQGIPSAILAHLFKPVQSTKSGNSGLGLTIVKTLIDELHGHISCYSSPQEGTEFKILIPRNLEEREGESI